MALPRWLTATVGRAAQADGRLFDYLTPGSGTNRVTNAGRSIVDPNVTYQGGIGGLFNGQADFKPPGQVLGANTTNLQDQGQDPTGGAYGAGGAGNGIDQGYKNGIADQLRSIISAYDSLYGGVDTTANDAIGNYNKQYGQQSDELNNQYGAATNQLAGQYGARGLADSSYYGNAQDEAKNTYDTNVQSLVDQRNQNLAQIGQQAAGAKAGYAGSRGQYAGILGNLDSYGQAGLQSLGGNLQGAQAGVQQAQAGQGTQADFIRSIQGLPALQNSGGSQLQAQLQKLSQTGAPSQVKNQIAQGIINQAQLQDPNQATQWNNYWQQLIGA